jgi:hypothetical protein
MQAGHHINQVWKEMKREERLREHPQPKRLYGSSLWRKEKKQDSSLGR